MCCSGRLRLGGVGRSYLAGTSGPTQLPLEFLEIIIIVAQREKGVTVCDEGLFCAIIRSTMGMKSIDYAH